MNKYIMNCWPEKFLHFYFVLACNMLIMKILINYQMPISFYVLWITP